MSNIFPVSDISPTHLILCTHIQTNVSAIAYEEEAGR